MKREVGFYWVLLEGSGWIIAEWTDKDYWIITCSYHPYDDEDFDAIDETRLIHK